MSHEILGWDILQEFLSLALHCLYLRSVQFRQEDCHIPCSKHFCVYAVEHFAKGNLLLDSFIDINLIHNFFLYKLHRKLHRIKFLYMFRASSAHLQEVNNVNCTCMQPLVFSFCKSELLCIKLVSIKELYYDARPTKSKKKLVFVGLLI